MHEWMNEWTNEQKDRERETKKKTKQYQIDRFIMLYGMQDTSSLNKSSICSNKKPHRMNCARRGQFTKWMMRGSNDQK